MRDAALLFLELGGVVLLLAALAALARRIGLSPIPLYLIGGLAFGEGGLVPVVTSEEFIEVGADLGVVLLLLMLGLEYTGSELMASLRSGAVTGIVDLVANFIPGFVAGLALSYGLMTSLFLGGVTYISSSGVVAKVLFDLGWVGNRETPIVLSVLVFEDLAMAVILPILGALAFGQSATGAVQSVVVALLAVGVILVVGARHGHQMSKLAFSGSDELSLLTLLGVTLVVAGIAEQLNVSAAVGAFLVGIGVSGEAADRARLVLTPLRDLFAAVFFVFFGLSTDLRVLPSVAIPVIVLAVVTSASKYATGWWAASQHGISGQGRRRAGTALIARGEFSVVIAGLALSAGADAEVAGLATAYVLVMATVGPIAARLADRPRAKTDPLA